MPSQNGASPNRAVLATGMGSAHRIVAQVMGRELAEQGIAEKPILFRKFKKNYALCFFSSHLSFSYDRQTLFTAPDPDIKLWAPANIPREVWVRATEQFRFGCSLEHNIDHFLLPILGCAPEYFAYERLLETTEQIFIAEGVCMAPIRKIKSSVYYFDTDRIYRKDQGLIFENAAELRRRNLWCCRLVNMGIWYKASTQFQEGASLRECIDLFFRTELLAVPQAHTLLERFVTRIEPASYEREPGNWNDRTFDRIRVYVNLSQTLYTDWDELKQAIREHRKDIDRMVLDKIANDRRFRKYGIPINSLKLSVLLLRRERCLEYIFELKDRIQNLSDPAL